jgi:hypothetical protein
LSCSVDSCDSVHELEVLCGVHDAAMTREVPILPGLA